MSLAQKTPLLAAALGVCACLAGCQDPVSPAAVLVEDELFITGITVDESNVYFIRQEGIVKRVSIDGGPPTEIASGITDPRHIGVDNTHVYWATSTGTIARAFKTGGDPEILLEGEPDLREMVVDNVAVYFTSGSDKAVRRLEKDQNALETLIVEDEGVLGPLAQQGGILYWSTLLENSTIKKMLATGGSASPLVGGQGAVTTVSADPSFVYWGSQGDGKITRLRPDGTDLTTVAVGQERVEKVIGDGKNVYWSSNDGSIATAPVDGTAEPFVLSTGPEGLTFLAQDEGYLYSARYETGTILVRPKVEDTAE